MSSAPPQAIINASSRSLQHPFIQFRAIWPTDEPANLVTWRPSSAEVTSNSFGLSDENVINDITDKQTRVIGPWLGKHCSLCKPDQWHYDTDSRINNVNNCCLLHTEQQKWVPMTFRTCLCAFLRTFQDCFPCLACTGDIKQGRYSDTFTKRINNSTKPVACNIWLYITEFIIILNNKSMCVWR